MLTMPDKVRFIQSAAPLFLRVSASDAKPSSSGPASAENDVRLHPSDKTLLMADSKQPRSPELLHPVPLAFPHRVFFADDEAEGKMPSLLGNGLLRSLEANGELRTAPPYIPPISARIQTFV